MWSRWIDGDGQFASPVAGGVIDRVGDRGRGADLPDLPDAFDAERRAIRSSTSISSTPTSGASALTGTR